MDDLNFLAIAVATVVVLVISTVYYIAWSKQLATLSPAYADVEANARPPAWKISVELIRSLVLAAVVAKLSQLLDVVDWTGALQLGLALWVGFPIVLWTGAVMWERVHPRLAAIHAGDWLLKILVIVVIVVLWR